jgi:hypothetical protein
MPLILSGNSGSTTLDSSAGLTFSDSSNQAAAASPFGLKNRIINGDMVIDQRNAGASVSNLAVTEQYTLDRWSLYGESASKFTAQQSSTAPSNYTNSFLLTSSAATTPSSGGAYGFRQKIEGYNVSDLSFGSATAATITLSFWVRSSIIGTYAIALFNSAQNRSYVGTYTISVANTWEQKSVIIAGDTSGTWLTTNGMGLDVWWDLGSGSGFNGTAGAWSSSFKARTSSSSNWIGTSGATFYITGVQLERNTTATPFEWIPYGMELALCQRYYNKWSGANSQNLGLTTCVANGGTAPGIRRASWANPVDFRAQPTLGLGGTIQLFTSGLSNLGFVAFNGTYSSKNIISFDINTTSSGTAGQGIMLIIDSGLAANYIEASAEL